MQYLTWLAGVLEGDLGRSYSLNRPVADEVAERFVPTIILAGAALFPCTLFGLLGGVIAAVKQYGWQDKLITLVVLIGISTPSFFLGILLILWFAVGLGWFPTGGMCALFGDGSLAELLHHLTGSSTIPTAPRASWSPATASTRSPAPRRTRPRSGSWSVPAARCWGARACLIGRPQLWGLAVAGEAGVAQVLEIYRREIDRVMGLCGIAGIAGIGPDLLFAAPHALEPARADVMATGSG